MLTNSKIIYLIVIDSLNIGGKERLALDQAYYLQSTGNKVKILLLNYPTDSNLAMLKMDQKFSKMPIIEIVSIPGSKIVQLIKLVHFFARHKKYFVVISHSTRALVLVRMASVIFFNSLIVHTMNQSLSLSTKSQAIKIALYCLFSHHLLAGCQPFIDEWKLYVNSSRIKKIIFSRKDIKLNRNGLYMPRLLQTDSMSRHPNDDVKRILYLGRAAEWKGTRIYGEISNCINKKGIKSVLAIPDILTESQKLRFGKIETPMEEIIGKPPTRLPYLDLIVHIYPADYGVGSTFRESISLNVMELLCLGVPSIITKNGRSTWPELATSIMLQDCDWGNLNEIEIFIEKLISIPSDVKAVSSLQAQELFSIENNLEGIFRIVKESRK
jgi:glycosyltransferase involved in cell wall biosynthesis